MTAHIMISMMDTIQTSVMAIWMSLPGFLFSQQSSVETLARRTLMRGTGWSRPGQFREQRMLSARGLLRAPLAALETGRVATMTKVFLTASPPAFHGIQV